MLQTNNDSIESMTFVLFVILKYVMFYMYHICQPCLCKTMKHFHKAAAWLQI